MLSLFLFFFFNDTPTTEIYTLSLHDALPIYPERDRAQQVGAQRRHDQRDRVVVVGPAAVVWERHLFPRLVDDAPVHHREDRKSTRLNSSHANISYAVFCLKKKKRKNNDALNN